MVNALIGLNNLKTRVDNLHVDKLKTILIDLKQLNDAVSKEVVKKRQQVHNKLNMKVHNLENKNSYVTTLIHIN